MRPLQTRQGRLAVAAFGAVLVAFALAVLLARSGPGSEEPATSGPTPEVSATVTDDAAAQDARNLKLEEAPQGLLQFLKGHPDAVPANALGVFYLDVATGSTEGWYDLIGGASPAAFSGEGRFTVFQLKEQVFLNGTIYPGGYYLADRHTGKVYRWDGPAQLVTEKGEFNTSEIATRGALVLFRFPVDGGNDWFSLFDVDRGRVVATFEAEGQWALISDDGSRVALAGPGVSVVDVASGTVVPGEQGLLDEIENAEPTGEIELTENAAADSFLVMVNNNRGSFEAAWARYGWQGKLLAQGQGHAVSASPNGALIAVAQPIPAGSAVAPWHSLDILSTKDGSPVFRVVGVDERYIWVEHDRWLADGSGIAIEVPGKSRLFAMRDGSFRDYVGVPSPDSASLFAVGGGPTGSVAVVDSDGNAVASAVFAGGVRDFIDPWGDSGDEMRVMVPHGGHDGPPLLGSIVQPYVEQAPYDGPPRIQIEAAAGAMGLTGLYDEPGGTAIDVVSPASRLTVDEVVMRCSGDVQDCPGIAAAAHGDFLRQMGFQGASEEQRLVGYWARVSTAAGQEGWMLLQVGMVGI